MEVLEKIGECKKATTTDPSKFKTKLKKQIRLYFNKCLVVTLGFRQITEMSLSGRDYPSLAQLAMNKAGSPSMSACTCLKARCVTSPPGREKVELPYRSKRVATELQGDGELFHSKVRFQGTSVLEGIRSLAEAGYATVPLPKHLTIIPTRARNSFLLARPSRQAATTGAASSRGDIAKNGSDHMNKSRNVSKSMEPTITVNKSGNKSSEQNKERAKSGRGRKK
ncbi:hypothetical protein MAR_027500 [Mya arenaria]|uniref:Uncharacterized protein n=1 Tax=Mya arenaria TaxID=6604 RepID=A0ABY7ETY7_MYAAR|nr:hypothetical protein MAR_027500 [Mya arenaria]